MQHTQFVSFVLLLTLFVSACGAVCRSKEDEYSGDDVLPFSAGATVEEVLAAIEVPLIEERDWFPDPSEYAGSNPPLPLMGTAQLEVTITPLRRTFVSGYSYDRENPGCEPIGAPELPIRITIRTSDGVLNEQVTGTLHTSGGKPNFWVRITKLEGSIRDHFASYKGPQTPAVQLEVRPNGITLLLFHEFDRPVWGLGYDHLTLL